MHNFVLSSEDQHAVHLDEYGKLWFLADLDNEKVFGKKKKSQINMRSFEIKLYYVGKKTNYDSQNQPMTVLVNTNKACTKNFKMQKCEIESSALGKQRWMAFLFVWNIAMTSSHIRPTGPWICTFCWMFFERLDQYKLLKLYDGMTGK